MISIEKSLLVVSATALADPSNVDVVDFYVSLDGGVTYKPSKQMQNVYVGQPFQVAVVWQCQPVPGYRAECTFTIEVWRGPDIAHLMQTLKQTLPIFSALVPAGGLYTTNFVVEFRAGMAEAGFWSLKVKMTASTVAA